MTTPEIEIHNGQIIVDGEAQPVAQPAQARKVLPGAPDKPEDIEPEEISRRITQAISQGIATGLTPIEITNSLLQLVSPAGHKLVWTRFDMFQIFAIWSKKLEGKSRL